MPEELIRTEPAVLRIREGRASPWHDVGQPSMLSDVPHVFASVEVVSAPRLGDTMLDQSKPWAGMRELARGLLSGSAMLPGCDALEVRYTTSPAAGENRVRFYLTAMVRSWDATAARTAIAAAADRLPAGFRVGAPHEDLRLGEDIHVGFEAIVELRRQEEVTEPQWEHIPTDFYYSILDEPGDGSGADQLWRALAATESCVTVSILAQQTDLSNQELFTLGSIETQLQIFSEAHTEYDILNNPIWVPACANARYAQESWRRRRSRMSRPLLMRLAVRGNQVNDTVRVATALASAVTSTTGNQTTTPFLLEPARTDIERQIANFSIDWLEIYPWGGHPVWRDQAAPNTLRRLPYLFGIDEAATLLALPVPSEQGVTGMPVTRMADSMREVVSDDVDSDGITLGRALHEGSEAGLVALPLQAINQHVLAAGSTGAGKTTTLMSIMTGLWRDHRIPTLVLETMGSEYRGLLEVPGVGDDLQIFTLGSEGISPIRLNPMEPPPRIRCEAHQSSLLASMKLALALFPPIPEILSKAIASCYEHAGWDLDSTSADGLTPPTLRDLHTWYNKVFAEIGYEGEARNIGRAFGVRLESLLQGSKGKIFDVVHSMEFDDVLDRPAVVEMEEIYDADDRAILSALLLDRVRAKAIKRPGARGTLKHVTIIEESHRLLSRADVNSGAVESGARAREDAIRSFCDAMGELRAYGEGFVLSTLSPSELAPRALKNSSTRLLHRTNSEEDRKVILDDMQASDRVRQGVARLRAGEALVKWPGRDNESFVRLAPAEGVDSERAVDDSSVQDHMTASREAAHRSLPFQACTWEICPLGCEPAVRRRGWQAADRLFRAGLTKGSPNAQKLIQEVARDQVESLQSTYCVLSHLSAHAWAFEGITQQRRSNLVEACREVCDGSAT